MTGYFARRGFSSLVSLFLFLTLLFFVTEIMIPGDFTTQFSLSHNRQQREEMRRELGLDLPLWERYLHWLSSILRGNLGTSLRGSPVLEVLKGMVPYTLLVFGCGTLIAFLFGQWLGRVVAWRGQGVLPGAVSLGAIMLYTTFPPWLAFLVTFVFVDRLGWLRAGRGDMPFAGPQDLWRKSPCSAPMIMLYMVLTFAVVFLLVSLLTRFLKRRSRGPLPAWWGWVQVSIFVLGTVGSWFTLGFGRHALDILKIAALPLLTYVLLTFGETMLIMRTSMMDTLKEGYVRTARAKGLPSHTVRDKHAARNALLPVLSRLVISLPYLLTGVVIVEERFGWPGLSGTLFDSFYQQDMPLILGALLVVGVFSVLARLALDVVYAYLDPRIRHAGPSA